MYFRQRGLKMYSCTRQVHNVEISTFCACWVENIVGNPRVYDSVAYILIIVLATLGYRGWVEKGNSLNLNRNKSPASNIGGFTCQTLFELFKSVKRLLMDPLLIVVKTKLFVKAILVLYKISLTARALPCAQ